MNRLCQYEACVEPVPDGGRLCLRCRAETHPPDLPKGVRRPGGDVSSADDNRVTPFDR